MVALVDLADAGRDHAVAAHREEDAGLTVKQHEQDRRDAGDGADADEGRAKVIADVAQGKGHWLRVVELGVGHDARQHAGDDDVEGRADDERADDADRQVMRGILALFGARRDGVEADVGKEDDGGAAEDARDAERHEGLPVHRVDVRDGQQQEDGDGRELDADEDAVELRALLRAADQQDGEQERDEDGGDVDDAAVCRHMRERVARVDAGREQQARDVAGPARGDGARGDGVLEDEVPADDEGDEFAERGVGVGVGAARRRHDGGEFRVGEARERAGEAGDHEGDRDGRARVLRGSDARQDEDAGADDTADAEQDEVKGAERLGHARVGSRLTHLLDAFGAE